MTDHDNEPAKVLIVEEETNTYWKDADAQSRPRRDVPAALKELVRMGRHSTALRPNPDAEHCGRQAAAATERGDNNAAALWIELGKLHALLHAR